MKAQAALGALGRIDLRNVGRDPMLVWLTALPLALALALRWGVPTLTAVLQSRYAFDLAPYNALILSFVAITMPTIVGAVIGFLLLDQRDDGTLSALQVTPLTLRGYLVYRAAAPMGLSCLMTAVALPASGLMTAGSGFLVLDAVVAAPLAPVFALFIATFASNKVQGFALMKGSGVVSWPAMIAWFLPMPWQLAMGVVPHYWIVKTVWVAEAGTRGTWLFAALALVYQLALLVLLLRRFDRVMRR